MDTNLSHPAPTFKSTSHDNRDFQHRDREIYGLLLHANRLVDNAGDFAFWGVIVAAAGACVGLHMRWFDALLSVDLGLMRGWSVYTLILVVGFVASISVVGVLQKAAYRKVREEIRANLIRTGLSRNELIAHIADDEKLEKISEQLQKDTAL